MRSTLSVGIVVALLSAVPLAAAQDHTHAGPVAAIVAHDPPPGGRTYVGDVASFAVIIPDDDGRPTFHQDMHIRVTLNGVTLYETTPASGHDYDATNVFHVVFPAAGTYTVEVLDDADEAMASFAGRVEVPAAPVAASVLLEGPDEASAGSLVDYTFQAVDGTGAILDHSDAFFEVRRGADVVFRTKTHTHDAPQTVAYAFPAPGTYTVRMQAFMAFATGRGAEFAPVASEMQVQVGPGVALPSPPPPAPEAPAALNAIVLGATDGPYELIGTYDPYTVVGPFTQQHLGVVVLDHATMQTVQHVDFTARLVGPAGAILFASETLHEYDGILEVLTVQPVPGAYRLLVDVAGDGWTGHVELPYTVAPPVAALSVGPQFVTVSGADALSAGVPATIELFAGDAAGAPFMHGEIDLQVVPKATGVPILATKLHTHGDGLFPFTMAFPAAGDYVLRLSPFPLEPRPTPVFFAAGGGPLEIPLSVADGPGIPAAPAGPAEDLAAASTDDTPVAPLVLGLLSLLGLAFVARRR